LAELSSRAAYSSGQRLRDALLYFPLVLGVLILLGVFVVVLFGPYLAPYNPYVVDRVVVPHYDFETEEYIRVPLTPREEFPLGSDEKGMDILSLLLYGARNTMIAGVLVAAAPGEAAPPAPARDRPAVGGCATAYVCRSFACSAPVTAPDALRALLASGA